MKLFWVLLAIVFVAAIQVDGQRNLRPKKPKSSWNAAVGWGNVYAGASIDQVKHVFFQSKNLREAIATLSSNGAVTSWGDSELLPGEVRSADFASGGGVKKFVSKNDAFSVLKHNGSVITWSFGSTGYVDMFDRGVEDIFIIHDTFAALKRDGTLVTWTSPLRPRTENVDFSSGGGVKAFFGNRKAFAALNNDGSVVTWGDARYGGNSTTVDFSSGGGVTKILSNAGAFTALNLDGSVLAWGAASYGGDSTSVKDALICGVQDVFTNGQSFAVLKSDGSVVTWGHTRYGGDSSGVDFMSGGGVLTIVPGYQAFAALKKDRTVVTWGNRHHGGDSSGVNFSSGGGVKWLASPTIAVKFDGSLVSWGKYWVVEIPPGAEVVQVCGEFAALRSDGTAVFWSPSGILETTDQHSSHGSWDTFGDDLVRETNIKKLFKTKKGAYAALKFDGTVVTSGFRSYGGVSTGINFASGGGVKTIFSASMTFIALKYDGSIVAWGYRPYNGGPSGAGLDSGGGIKTIVSSSTAFASIQMDGTLRTWGEFVPHDNINYDTYDSLDDAPLAFFDVEEGDSFEKIIALDEAFVAIRRDGSTEAWGLLRFDFYPTDLASFGGGVKEVYQARSDFFTLMDDGSIFKIPMPESYGKLDPTPIRVIEGGAKEFLTTGNGRDWVILMNNGSVLESHGSLLPVTGFQRVFSTYNAFAGLMHNGSVFTWGDSSSGGNSATVDFFSGGGVRAVFSTSSAFAALKNDGSVVSWGASSTGGDSSSINFTSGGGVSTIVSNDVAFAALKNNQSVVTWGSSTSGGDSSQVEPLLRDGVISITANVAAFAALKDDGSVVAWGHAEYGGDSSTVDFSIGGGVQSVFSTERAFAGLTRDGSVVSWGNRGYGGDSSAADFSRIRIDTLFANSKAFLAVGQHVPHVTPTWEPTAAPVTSTLAPVLPCLPTQKPTALPTSSPTPFVNCKGVNLLISVDQSQSVKQREFERQKQVVQTILDHLKSSQDRVGVSLTTFGLDHIDNIPVGSIASSGAQGGSNTTYVTEEVMRVLAGGVHRPVRFSNFLPLFDSDHGVALAESAQNPVILILSDGEPFVPGLRSGRLANREACRTARSFKKEHPKVRILCFQSDLQSKTKHFFRCACDAIWRANDLSTNTFDAGRVALEIFQNRMCTPMTKQPNPCESINFAAVPTSQARRLLCIKVRRDSRGLPIDTGNAMQSPRSFRQCYWRRGRCRTLAKYSPLYANDN